MPNKQNNSLIVQVDSISLSGQAQHVWTAEGEVLFNIDSTLTQMWLPLEACKAFEDAFGIVWNETAQLYLLNETTRDNLQRLNPVVNITIRESEQRSVTFSLPYTAFDLTATAPLVEESSSPYFPLKRASGLFVLGRVFLQETYISIDYDRARFNISQAYPQGGSTRVIAILPPSNTTSNGTANDTDSAPPPKSKALSSQAIAAIAVSITVVSAVGIGLLIAWRKRWGFFARDAPEQEQERVDKAEMSGESKPWVEVMSNEKAELVATEHSQEMHGIGRRVAELEGSTAYRELGTGGSST
jgi:hypothetical protein